MAEHVVVAANENIFAALGFAEEQAESLRIRANLMDKVRELIDSRNLTQQQAAALFGVSQPRISDLVRGKIQKFSIDNLVTMLARANIRVSVAEVIHEPVDQPVVTFADTFGFDACQTALPVSVQPLAIYFTASYTILTDTQETQIASERSYALAA